MALHRQRYRIRLKRANPDWHKAPRSFFAEDDNPLLGEKTKSDAIYLYTNHLRAFLR